MQYVEGSMKAGKPYRQRRMTDSNCAISVEHQARLYAEWARDRGLKVIHIFPPGKTGNARRAYEKLLKCDLDPNTKLVDVDPEDWK